MKLLKKSYLALGVLLFTPCYASNDDSIKEDVIIYSGPSTDQRYNSYCTSYFKKGNHNANIVYSGPDEIRKLDWQRKTSIFVIGKGGSTAFHDSLKGEGNQNIKNFVQEGGSFLGIGAGAYYGCSKIQFLTWGEKERELGFFSGKSEGPSLSTPAKNEKQPYSSISARINWVSEGPLQGKVIDTFYFIGGHFLDVEKDSNIEVLAYYDIAQIDPKYKDTQPTFPAIIKVKYGEGTAILSGINFEWISNDDDLHDGLSTINESPNLEKIDQMREEILKHLRS